MKLCSPWSRMVCTSRKVVAHTTAKPSFSMMRCMVRKTEVLSSTSRIVLLDMVFRSGPGCSRQVAGHVEMRFCLTIYTWLLWRCARSTWDLITRHGSKRDEVQQLG